MNSLGAPDGAKPDWIGSKWKLPLDCVILALNHSERGSEDLFLPVAPSNFKSLVQTGPPHPPPKKKKKRGVTLKSNKNGDGMIRTRRSAELLPAVTTSGFNVEPGNGAFISDQGLLHNWQHYPGWRCIFFFFNDIYYTGPRLKVALWQNDDYLTLMQNSVMSKWEKAERTASATCCASMFKNMASYILYDNLVCGCIFLYKRTWQLPGSSVGE